MKGFIKLKNKQSSISPCTKSKYDNIQSMLKITWMDILIQLEAGKTIISG